MCYPTSQDIIALGSGSEVTYAHTHLARHWLQTGGAELTQLIVKDLAKVDPGDYFKENDSKALEEPSRCPGICADGAKGKDWFQAIPSDTDRLRRFDGAMQYVE